MNKKKILVLPLAIVPFALASCNGTKTITRNQAGELCYRFDKLFENVGFESVTSLGNSFSYKFDVNKKITYGKASREGSYSETSKARFKDWYISSSFALKDENLMNNMVEYSEITNKEINVTDYIDATKKDGKLFAKLYRLDNLSKAGKSYNSDHEEFGNYTDNSAEGGMDSCFNNFVKSKLTGLASSSFSGLHNAYCMMVIANSFMYDTNSIGSGVIYTPKICYEHDAIIVNTKLGESKNLIFTSKNDRNLSIKFELKLNSSLSMIEDSANFITFTDKLVKKFDYTKFSMTTAFEEYIPNLCEITYEAKGTLLDGKSFTETYSAKTQYSFNDVTDSVNLANYNVEEIKTPEA